VHRGSIALARVPEMLQLIAMGSEISYVGCFNKYIKNLTLPQIKTALIERRSI
jgi:hypothetical protein